MTKDAKWVDRRKSRRPNAAGLKKVNARVDRLILRFNRLVKMSNIIDQAETLEMSEEE